LTLTPEGEVSAIAALGPDNTSMLHWHGDTFDLPPKATLLASTEQVAHQAFSWDHFVLGLQCHPEVRHEDIESWLIGHSCEIAAAHGVSVEQLRKDTHYFGPALAACSRTMFTDWLVSVGLATGR
jgi:GMP synthase (glutamine-hydrolysing)